MRILCIGAGGVGGAAAGIAARRGFFEAFVVADYDVARAESVVQSLPSGLRERFEAVALDASSKGAVADAIRRHRITHVFNAVDPRFVMPIFEGAAEAGATYLDMAMSLSTPHPEVPYQLPGLKLGDLQFDQSGEWEAASRLALVGMGVEPGLSDVFAAYAQEFLFSRIDELAVRDGANLVVEGYDFAPSFSIWTTIEECLNPPVVYSSELGWRTTEPFSEPEVFDFPEGIGPVECVNVEHEEVLLMPRWIDAKTVNFKYGLGNEFIEVLRVLHKLGLDSTEPVNVKGSLVSPRDVVAACLPDPATLGPKITGKTCAGVLVRGKDKEGNPRSTYLYHVADNAWTMENYASQCVVWQTAINPIIALELLASGTWTGAGVLGPEAFPAKPFLDLMAAPEPEGYGSPWHIREETN
ncbi:saccharopine dehydrogenase family protein [Arthrobacter sp. 2MCAF15]|uniref:saccharopine dehydrogenase family protein n=1 Tax=Arthrobacter sp. 2MCAF15 TaxID=3232984 RepID=UPI003F934725